MPRLSVIIALDAGHTSFPEESGTPNQVWGQEVKENLVFARKLNSYEVKTRKRQACGARDPLQCIIVDNRL